MQVPVFMTIRQTARTGLISEHRLRLLVAQGKAPGVYSGNRFMVNYDQLIDMLNDQSKANAGGMKHADC